MPVQYKKTFLEDFKSGIIVALVALPLCLGIALASGAPLLSGLISGIIGGLLIGSLSPSHVSVSGPAAGLAVIVLGAIQDLGTFHLFLTSVILAGTLQLTYGLLKMGRFTKHIDHSVIEGMLSSIGILIIIKQLPYALGVLKFSGYRELITHLSTQHFDQGALFVGLLCLGILAMYTMTEIKNKRIFKLLPLSIVLVLIAILLAWIFEHTLWQLDPDDFVNIGHFNNMSDVFSHLERPQFENWFNLKVFKYALIISIVASIETLLCIEAGDKLDPQKRTTDKDKELKAQGIGNIISGCLGGLPMTSVIVRTSVNIQSGAKTKNSTITHGIVLLLSVLLFPQFINTIPLAVLACILLNAGFNLAHPRMIYEVCKKHFSYSIPFLATIIAIVSTDLLTGVIFGQLLSTAMHFLLKSTQKAKNAKH